MALDTFRQWPEPTPWLQTLEAKDLVYYSRTPSGRATTGAPLLAGREARLALRDGLGLTLAIADADEIVPWVFMPRRGALTKKTLRGVRLSSLEAGTETYAVDLYGGPAAVTVLRALLPLLDGRFTAAAIAQHFDSSDRALVGAVLTWLDDCACLTHVSPSKLQVGAPSVTWLGHAAVLVRVGNVTLLVDPLFVRRSDPPKPFIEAGFDWRLLPKVDAVLITHADNDHLNPGSLEDKPYQVDLHEVLRFLSFDDVRPLSDWSTLQLGDTRVTAVPFQGEDWGLSLAKATYLIEGPGGRVYVSADSFNASSLFERVRSYGPIDFAFLGISGCEETLVAPPGFGYGEFYALWLPRGRRNEWIAHTQGPSDAAIAARALNARHVFGYAAGGGSFMEMAHADRGTHAELAEILGERAVRLTLGDPYSL
jgi:L-ascorbate metabolism protein UlaG (beta-lactamase superfamily)